MNDPGLIARDLREMAAEIEGLLVGVVAPAGEDCWIAVLLIDGQPCYVIGGPGIDDDRVFATPEAALAALAFHLGQQAEDYLRVEGALQP